MLQGTKEEMKYLEEQKKIEGWKVAKVAFHDLEGKEQFLNPEVDEMLKGREDEEELIHLLETNIIGAPDFIYIDEEGNLWFEEFKTGIQKQNPIKDHQFGVAVRLALAGYETKIFRFEPSIYFDNNRDLSDFN